MTRRERLMRTLNGQTVDRPAVSFYEIDGFRQDRSPENPYNIYSDPSWAPLLDLAAEETDVMSPASVRILNNGNALSAPFLAPENMVECREYEENDSLFSRAVINTGNGALSSLARRDKDINTTWVTEHLLKDTRDLETWIDLPMPDMSGEVETASALDLEKRIGEAGIIRLETADPLCIVASLFDMAAYTIIAMTEPDLFKRALDKAAEYLMNRLQKITEALPGRLWRICGPEYASPPYLPPRLFEEYVTVYDKPMVEMIQKSGGYARIHSHGKLKDILDMICETGCVGLDPVEPPPQGDVELGYVRERYGEQLVLFGNLEASDIENLSTEKFSEKIKCALEEGTQGSGRGFVLMPSACPYGRKLSSLSMKNYEKMIELVNDF